MVEHICPNCGKAYQSGDEVCRYCGFILPFSTAVLTPGKLLRQRYEIQGLAHSGGMGYVYFAKDKNLYDRICVVKQVKEPVKSDTDRKRLEEEALRMSKLSHSNAAMILDQFVEGGYYFLVVQHISGKTLSQVLEDRHGQLTEEEVVNWAISMCDVVSYLHGKGVIHRDISPENIMLTDEGAIMFIDFGTMRELRQITSQKTAGIGKFGFTPPEQWQGQPVAQSDTFAIGATVYYLLTEYLPLSAEYQRGQKPQPSDFRPSFPAIQQKNPNVSGELEVILEKALQLEVNSRYQSAQELGQALTKARAKPAAPGHEPGLSTDTAGKKSRKRLPIIIGGSIGALALLVVSVLAMSGTFTPSPPPPVLNVDPQSIDFSDLEPESGVFDKSLTVTNTGDGTLTGTLTTTKDWLHVSPAEIEVADAEKTIRVRVDTTGLSYGLTDSGYINIKTDGGEENIKVTLAVANPPPPPLPSNVIFQDDFSDPYSGWFTGMVPGGGGEFAYKNGGLRALVNKANWAILATNSNAGQLDDFALEVDTKALSSVKDSWQGVIFRLVDTIKVDNFYLFAIQSGFANYRIEKLSGGKWTNLKASTYSSYIHKGTATNRLKVVCKGAVITVYANDHELATITDASYSIGGIALAAESGATPEADVLFDNLKITTLD